MVRKTSINVYNEIKNNGLLSKRRFEIYSAVFKYGPVTAMEVFKKLKLNTNQSGRFSELRDMGVIQEVGEKQCSITGRTAIIWEATDNLPKEINTKQSKKEKKDYILDVLRSLYSEKFMTTDAKNKINNLAKRIKEL